MTWRRFADDGPSGLSVIRLLVCSVSVPTRCPVSHLSGAQFLVGTMPAPGGVVSAGLAKGDLMSRTTRGNERTGPSIGLSEAAVPIRSAVGRWRGCRAGPSVRL